MQLLNGNIEEMILKHLSSGEQLSTDEVILGIRKVRGKVTNQGVYRVLRKLVREDKIVLYKSHVKINRLWVEALKYFAAGAHTNSIIGDILGLQEGEQLSLKLKGLAQIDRVWLDIFNSIEDRIANIHPLYLSNPHNWSIILRKNTDTLQINKLNAKSRPVFLSIHGNSKLDKLTIQMLKKLGIHNCQTAKASPKEYIAVLDDVIIKIRFSAKSNARINSIFSNCMSTEEAYTELLQAESTVSASLTVERNSEKSKSIKKVLARDFYIPQKHRDY